MDLKVGQILNFKYYDGPFQKAVRHYNRKIYGVDGFTHSAIITYVSDVSIEIAEALEKGFTISNYERWWVEGKIKEGVISVGTAYKPLNNVRYYANKYKGTKYSYWAVFLILIFGKNSIKLSDGVKSLICSEAVARLLYDASDKKIDFEPEFKKNYDFITPQDLYLSKQIKWI